MIATPLPLLGTSVLIAGAKAEPGLLITASWRAVRVLPPIVQVMSIVIRL